MPEVGASGSPAVSPNHLCHTVANDFRGDGLAGGHQRGEIFHVWAGRALPAVAEALGPDFIAGQQLPQGLDVEGCERRKDEPAGGRVGRVPGRSSAMSAFRCSENANGEPAIWAVLAGCVRPKIKSSFALKKSA